MRFRCSRCGNTTRFWVYWRGEVSILHDRHLDERASEYPFDYANPEDYESARLILTTPTFNVGPEALLSEVICSDCEARAEDLRWVAHGQEWAVPLGQREDDFRPYGSEN